MVIPQTILVISFTKKQARIHIPTNRRYWKHTLCRLRQCRAFVAILSLFCRKSTVAGSFDNCRTTTDMNIYEARYDLVASDIVSTMSPVRINWRRSPNRQLVAVDIVAKVIHAQFGRLSFLSPECRTAFVEFDKIDRGEFDFVRLSPLCTGPKMKCANNYTCIFLT